jgi:glucan phosphoethanolaminetransferase (alkaline phosphatase superfamily)
LEYRRSGRYDLACWYQFQQTREVALSWSLLAAQLFFCLFTVVLLIEFMDRKTLGRFIAFVIFMAAAASSYYLNEWWPLAAAFILVLILETIFERLSLLRRPTGWWMGISENQRRAKLKAWFATGVALSILILPFFPIASYLHELEERNGGLNQLVKVGAIFAAVCLLFFLAMRVERLINPPSLDPD